MSRADKEVKRIRKLKRKIIAEFLMIIGCMLLISVYISGCIGMLITPRIYFSDFWESTIITLLSCVILFFVMKDHNADLKILTKIKEENQ